MELNIKTNKNIEEIADFIALSINRELQSGKKVLWFVCGGSSILLEVLASKKIQEENSDNLVVTLTDERYGPVGHPNSNWAKLKEAGFSSFKAKFIPIITGDDLERTAINIGNILKNELDKSEYKIGVFGIGIDNHTAGILPHSKAVNEDNLVCFYKTPEFDRITITPKTILMLDEAVVYAMGEKKWPIIENLKYELSLDEAPSQVLKKVPVLTIFTDYKK